MMLEIEAILSHIFACSICFATPISSFHDVLLQTCFDLFDTKKVDFLSADDLGEIMRAMGFRPTEEELKDLLAEIDEDGSGKVFQLIGT